MRYAVLFVLGILLVPLSARADFYDGLRAYDAKDYRGAFDEWKASANEGDARSQLHLGQLYEKGLGVPQNYVEAHRWYNLAASHGGDDALAARDRIAEKISAEQVAQAQELAAAWNPTRKTEPSSRPAASQSAQTDDSVATPETTSQSPAGPEALLAAAERGDLNAVKSALSEGIGIDSADADGWTALMFASVTGRSELVRHLIQAGANLDVRAKDGATPLIGAALTGRTEVVKALIAAGADVGLTNKAGATALAMAQAKGHAGVVALLSTNDDPTKAQVAESQLELVRLGYNPGPVDGVAGRRTAGAVAAFQGSIGVPRDGRITVSLLHRMKAAKPTPKAERSRKLKKFFTAAEKGDTATVKRLIEAGIDVNATDKDGWTALMFAAAQGRTEILSLLLKSKANINRQNRDGNTALIMAAISRNLDAVKALTAGNPDYELRNKDGASAQFVAYDRYTKLLMKEDKTDEESKLKDIDDKIAYYLKNKGALSNNTIKRMQDLLAELDYFGPRSRSWIPEDPPYEEQGFVGPKTLEAVKKYQRKNRIEVNGKITPDLVDRVEKERKTKYETMLQRASRSHGILSGNHGIYYSDCDAVQLGGSLKWKTWGTVLWSEGDIVYMGGSSADPFQTVLIRLVHSDVWTLTNRDSGKQTRHNVNLYSAIGASGNEITLVIGDGMHATLSAGETSATAAGALSLRCEQF